MVCRASVAGAGAHRIKLGEHWVRNVAGWAYIFLAIVTLSLAVLWLLR
jgi:hypothetical protein